MPGIWGLSMWRDIWMPWKLVMDGCEGRKQGNSLFKRSRGKNCLSMENLTEEKQQKECKIVFKNVRYEEGTIQRFLMMYRKRKFPEAH